MYSILSNKKKKLENTIFFPWPFFIFQRELSFFLQLVSSLLHNLHFGFHHESITILQETNYRKELKV